MSQLTLYYYEHCPYCVRVLVLAGMAAVPLKHRVLLNDDEQTPMTMIGAKMLPILEVAPQQFMAESLDIMDYLCAVSKFDLEKNHQDIQLVEEFLQQNRLLIYGLSMPRWVKMPFAEFATAEAVAYFTEKKTQTIGDFSLALQNTPTLSKALHTALADNTDLFERLANKPHSLAAIMLFSGLLGISSVQGFDWTEAAEHLMQTLSQLSKVALLTAHAV